MLERVHLLNSGQVEDNEEEEEDDDNDNDNENRWQDV